MEISSSWSLLFDILYLTCSIDKGYQEMTCERYFLILQVDQFKEITWLTVWANHRLFPFLSVYFQRAYSTFFTFYKGHGPSLQNERVPCPCIKRLTNSKTSQMKTWFLLICFSFSPKEGARNLRTWWKRMVTGPLYIN